MDIPREDLEIECITLRDREHLGSLHLNDGKHAIRVTHIPTGLRVEVQHERGGAHKMRNKAISMIEWGLLQ
jgi:protein subunit release factor A